MEAFNKPPTVMIIRAMNHDPIPTESNKGTSPKQYGMSKSCRNNGKKNNKRVK